MMIRSVVLSILASSRGRTVARREPHQRSDLEPLAPEIALHTQHVPKYRPVAARIRLATSPPPLRTSFVCGGCTTPPAARPSPSAGLLSSRRTSFLFNVLWTQ